MAIEKPSWLADALSWLNFEKGEWVDWSFVVIPPFSFMPGEWIEKAIDWLLDYVNNIVSSLKGVWDYAIVVAQDTLDALGKIDDWLAAAAGWFGGQVADWWSGAWEDVKAWANAKISDTITAVGTLWTWFAGIDDWINAELAPVYTWVDDQLGERLEPFKAILAFWTLFGTNMVTFFQNPWEWLEGKLEGFLFGEED